METSCNRQNKYIPSGFTQTSQCMHLLIDRKCPQSPEQAHGNNHFVLCHRQQITFCSCSLCGAGRFPSCIPHPPAGNRLRFPVIKVHNALGSRNSCSRTKASSWMQRLLALLHETRALQHPPLRDADLASGAARSCVTLECLLNGCKPRAYSRLTTEIVWF